jgi:hypothetical protein
MNTYYEACAPLVLPTTRHRSKWGAILALKRAMRGKAGFCFVQRIAPGQGNIIVWPVK